MQKIHDKYVLANIYQLTKSGGLMKCGSKYIFKSACPASFTNAHDDVTDMVNYGIIKNTQI